MFVFMRIFLICNINSWQYLFFIACSGKTTSDSDVSTSNPDEYTESSVYSRRRPLRRSHYKLSKLQEEKGHDEVARTLTPLRPQAVSARRIAQLKLLPPILYRQGASPLHEGENAKLWREMNRLRWIAYYYNDETDE